jgi:ABC-type transport system involved in multi-copper enzyme maturation permease subunit
MKYFAILKDSLREALDSKSLFVLVALSTLAIGAVATVSFKPLSAERTMQQFFGGGNVIPLALALDSHKPEKMEGHGNGRMMAMGQFRLVSVDQLEGETDAPDGLYRLTLAPQVVGNDNDQAMIDAVHQTFKDAEDFNYLKIQSVERAKNEKEGAPPRYLVTLKGTSQTHRVWAAEPSIFFGAVPIGGFAAPMAFQIYIMAAVVLGWGAWIAVLVGVVITSFFIPNMLRKGTVDLLLAKPIQRWLLLIYKYLGGLAFVFLVTGYAVGGMWLVLGIRTGLWANGTLLLVLTITFFFAILYAVSTFVGVVTRSTISSIMVTIAAWFVFWLIGTVYQALHNQYLVEQEREKKGMPVAEDMRWGDGKLANTVYAIHAVTPRTGDLAYLDDLIVFTDFMTGDLTNMGNFDSTKRNWVESVAISAGWIIVFLGLAAAWFTYKDY